MEVYTGELANVSIKVPVTAITGTFDVSAYDGSALLYTFSTVTAISGGYQVTLPFSLVDSDRNFVIKWRFNYLQNSVTKSYAFDTTITVVTPYVTSLEITSAISEASSLSSAELVRLERRIRGVIDTFVGHDFGKTLNKTQTVFGAGDKELKLPNRLAAMTNLTGYNIITDADGVTHLSMYSVYGDGFYIGLTNPTPYGNNWVWDNVIRIPNERWTTEFKLNAAYVVTGDWGYSEVPSQVREAALILAENYICPQTEYRERYLKSIGGDGWRYEFNPNAYYGTGSVIADQLLEPFRRSTMMVI